MRARIYSQRLDEQQVMTELDNVDYLIIELDNTTLRINPIAEGIEVKTLNNRDLFLSPRSAHILEIITT